MSKKELKLLIVDDIKDYRENIKEILEIKNYLVDTAADGKTALKKVEDDNFDLVLMDIKMPVMNGLEAYKQIKKIKPNLPVIMISAFAVEDLIKKSLRKGAYGYTSKPIDFEKLFNMIDNAIKEGGIIHIIDDDEELSSNIEEILKSKGYNVFKASSGSEAVEIAETHKPDIILLDMKLPPINGLDTYMKIKDLRPEAVVILITAYKKEMKVEIEDLLSKSIYEVLEKPIDIDETIKIIEKIEKEIKKKAKSS